MMVLKSSGSSSVFRRRFVLLFFYASALSGAACAQTNTVKSATIGDIKAFFQGKQKTVLTFVGYSGAGYEDEASMLKQAERILGEFDPAKTIVSFQTARVHWAGQEEQGAAHLRSSDVTEKTPNLLIPPGHGKTHHRISFPRRA